MSDFRSALYLGIRHSSRELEAWKSLTTGMPAVLGTPPAHRHVAQLLARLQGCERGVLGRSTMHLMWDLFGMCSHEDTALYLDAGAYPIAQWGAQSAACRGRPVQRFPHHNAGALGRLLRRDAQHRRRPIVVTDGWCPRCGCLAPLDAFLAQAQRYGGKLIVDDTQALGILGERCPDSETPYGAGGGGSLRWFGIEDPNVIVVASLAKAFGAPLAVFSSSDSLVRQFAAASETRVHTSPPSMADVRAAEHALAVNAACGESLRRHLGRLVCRLRQGLIRLGLSPRGGMFPVQTFAPPGMDLGELHRRLCGQGIKLLRLGREPPHEPGLAMAINAGHQRLEIDGALQALSDCLCGPFIRC